MKQQNIENKKNHENIEAQGAIEYLLIIGASILVVAIVIIALVTLSTSASTNTNEGQNVLNPLQQLVNNQLQNDDIEEPPTTQYFTSTYFTKTLETTTAKTILSTLPSGTNLEISGEYCKLYGPNHDYLSCSKGSTNTVSGGDLDISENEIIKLSCVQCEEEIELPLILEELNESYGEFIISFNESDKFFYFTPNDSIETLFSDAPEGIYITIKKINDEEILKTYRKIGESFVNEYNNGLFDIIEQSDLAKIHISFPEYPKPNYSKKIVGTINLIPNTNNFFEKEYGCWENEIEYNSEIICEKENLIILTKDYYCYTKENLLNKIKEELNDINFYLETTTCTLAQGNDWMYGNYEYCSNKENQLTPADIIQIYTLNPNDYYNLNIDFSCD